MFCQVCGAHQNDEAEYCSRCHQKLLVLSGQGGEEAGGFESQDESFSFDEHLLERISILEEVLKKTTDTMRNALGLLQKLEKSVLLNNTGLESLVDHLETQDLVSRGDWTEGWEARAQAQLLALEKRDKLSECRARSRLCTGAVAARPSSSISTRPSPRSCPSNWTRRSVAWRPRSASTPTTTSSPSSWARRSSTRAGLRST